MYLCNSKVINAIFSNIFLKMIRPQLKRDIEYNVIEINESSKRSFRNEEAVMLMTISCK